jgi:hypothetical protein
MDLHRQPGYIGRRPKRICIRTRQDSVHELGLGVQSGRAQFVYDGGGLGKGGNVRHCRLCLLAETCNDTHHRAGGDDVDFKTSPVTVSDGWVCSSELFTIADDSDVTIKWAVGQFIFDDGLYSIGVSAARPSTYQRNGDRSVSPF